MAYIHFSFHSGEPMAFIYAKMDAWIYRASAYRRQNIECTRYLAHFIHEANTWIHLKMPKKLFKNIYQLIHKWWFVAFFGNKFDRMKVLPVISNQTRTKLNKFWVQREKEKKKYWHQKDVNELTILSARGATWTAHIRMRRLRFYKSFFSRSTLDIHWFDHRTEPNFCWLNNENKFDSLKWAFSHLKHLKSIQL